MKIGIIKEGKFPPDRRVPLIPKQCARIRKDFPEVQVCVQSSDVRAFTDDEYRSEGVEIVDSLEDCDLILGVKEIPVDMLIPERAYCFFSHTIKEQPYNRDLLRTILKRGITLIDYEVMVNEKGVRLIGFGRYAGIVGCYNGLLAYGKRTGRYQLKPANQCRDRKEMESELSKLDLPDDFKIVLTGRGRVGHGAVEVLEKAGVVRVSPENFLNDHLDQPVFTWLTVSDYNERIDGTPFSKADFYADPKPYRSTFIQFAKVADLYISGHYWDSESPFLFTREDMKNPDWNVKVVADISCDIDGPVACTIRPSTIENPLYGYDPESEKETAFDNPNGITVMAVDNLPCELPRDASEDFGEELIRKILPHFLDDRNNVIKRATIAKEGDLTPRYEYLRNYVEGTEKPV